MRGIGKGSFELISLAVEEVKRSNEIGFVSTFWAGVLKRIVNAFRARAIQSEQDLGI